MQKPDELQELAWVRDALASGEAQKIRERSHLTTGDIARAIDVTPSSVWRYEQLVRSPRGPVALRYGRLLRRLQEAVLCSP
jgi:DNA-binding transcriptional regulator YiaG